jgi:hypothetical protein
MCEGTGGKAQWAVLISSRGPPVLREGHRREGRRAQQGSACMGMQPSCNMLHQWSTLALLPALAVN